MYEVDGPAAGFRPAVGSDATTFLFSFLRFSARPGSSLTLFPTLLFITFKSSAFASPSGKSLRLKYSPPYSSNLYHENELEVSVFIPKERAYHSASTAVTVRMNDFVVRTYSLKITHWGKLLRPQDG